MKHPHGAESEQLLEYHLGLLGDEQAEHVRREIAQSTDAAARSHKLAEWIKLLDLHETTPPPADLVDRIMNKVDQTSPLRITEAASSLPPSSEGGILRRPLLSLRELVALAACITFFIGVVIPGISRKQSQARQALCAGNLGAIYRGLAQYSASFNGHLPQTAGFLPGINWLRSPRPEVPRVPNSRNRYLVVRLRFVMPKSFICPEVDGARPMDPEQIERFDDFASLENCSFDSQNMAGPTLPLGTRYCMPIYADRNPLFDGGEVRALDPSVANSRSHHGLGQNVLCSDGRVAWTETPVFGPQGDNIWQIEGMTRYTGTEYQRNPADAFVIP